LSIRFSHNDIFAMHTVQFLNHLIESNLVLAYVLIFFTTIFEGEIVAISSGILVLLGVLDWGIVLPIIFLGGMMKTILGYFLGKFIYRKFNKNKFLKYIERRVRHVMPHFERKPFWSIFISKFILINHLVIIFSGYKNINFKKYLQAEICSTILWAPALLMLGYFFSYTAIRVSHEIWKFSLVVVILIILFIIFDKLIAWVYELFEEFYDNPA